MSIVYLFPGQGSHTPEVIDRLCRTTSQASRILANASEILNRDLEPHFNPQNASMFNRHRDIQVGVFLANYMFARLLEVEGFYSDASVGFSLGEYNHLVEIGALGFADALKIVEARGMAYETGPAGMMLSVFPCDESNVAKALTHARSLGSVDIAIRLSKSQFVLAGETAAVQLAGVWLEKQAHAQTRVIDSRLPMHSPMFRTAAETFKPALERAVWQAPMMEYWPNTEGAFYSPASSRELIGVLFHQVFSTVQWTRSIRLLAERYPAGVFVEVGPGGFLTENFKHDYSHIPCLRTDDGQENSVVFKTTVERLRAKVHAA